MRQARAEMIAGAVQENLRLIFQPAKRPRMNDAGPVALEFRAIGVARLGKFSSPRVAGFLRERREHSSLVRFHFFPRLPSLTRDSRRHANLLSRQGIIRHHAGFASLELAALEKPAVLNFRTLQATLRQSMSRRSKKSQVAGDRGDLRQIGIGTIVGWFSASAFSLSR